MTMIGLRYDLRVPSFCSVTHAELYAACLEQCAWADRLGLDFVVLSEHHGVDDGYLPAPLTLAAAIAGRTKSIRINVAAVLVPLHDPVRLAEQLAVLDLASGSRVGLIAGLGYRREEFVMAGVDRAERGRRLRPPPERAGLRPRERRPRARLGAHRAARALRCADLRVVADARPALVDARGGEERRRAAAKRRLPRGDAHGVRGARAGDG